MKKLLLTGAVLLVLWGVSFGVSYVDFGRASLGIALAIAALKAAIVVGVFMELAHARRSIQLAVVAASVLAVVLIGLVLTDIGLRATT